MKRGYMKKQDNDRSLAGWADIIMKTKKPEQVPCPVCGGELLYVRTVRYTETGSVVLGETGSVEVIRMTTVSDRKSPEDGHICCRAQECRRMFFLRDGKLV